ncbi:Zinc finger ccch domain-containing protein [Thalictrum thalictroides]|uniref:Zinc finger ccch domain-containing protein n=1 Tax=Thalictrum thalictroides TaxID=46969 RepID=A0A7J6W881_THATH|nr:Zinc finger ccch domain-containing protein [Thalictrum thalictroides]
MEPHQKRFRSENGGYWPNPRVSDQFGNGSGGGGGNLQHCKRFKTPEGCPYGSNCRFLHVSSDSRDNSTGKPKPCMKFFSTSGCPYGESCHFMHYIPGGLSSLGLSPIVSLSAAPPVPYQRKALPTGDPSISINGYKTKLCNRFNTDEGCRFGDKCHFAHGERDLRLPNNQTQGNIQRAPPEEQGIHPHEYKNEGSDISNLGTLPKTADLVPQGYGEVISPEVAASDGSANCVTGCGSENLQVY